jgi:hypothetical protein
MPAAYSMGRAVPPLAGKALGVSCGVADLARFLHLSLSLSLSLVSLDSEGLALLFLPRALSLKRRGYFFAVWADPSPGSDPCGFFCALIVAVLTLRAMWKAVTLVVLHRDPCISLSRTLTGL